MGDLKSKLPDLKEITSIATKLYQDIKTSVGEIVTDYKQKHNTPKATETTTKKPKKNQ